jgi:hypothetical protein
LIKNFNYIDLTLRGIAIGIMTAYLHWLYLIVILSYIDPWKLYLKPTRLKAYYRRSFAILVTGCSMLDKNSTTTGWKPVGCGFI